MSAGEAGHWVWVYGSLMSSTSLLEALQPRATAPDMQRRAVTGWRRCWCCLSAKTFRTASGQHVRRVVAGLERAPEFQTEGVLLGLDARDMELVRAREQAYDELDITAAVDNPPGRVVTFLPKQTRDRALVTSHLPLVVERSYFDTCIRGATEHGLEAVVEELESALDLELTEPAGDVVWAPPP